MSLFEAEDPFEKFATKRKPRAMSRDQQIQVNASSLAIAAMAPPGFKAAEALEVKEKANRPYNPRYTTNAAIEWVKAKGGVVLATEENQAYRDRRGIWQRRKADQKMCADVIYRFAGKVFGLQAAGEGEEARHLVKFNNAGGPVEALKVYDEFLYLEFERGKPDPVKVRKWA